MTEYYGETFGAPNWGIYQQDDEINMIKKSYGFNDGGGVGGGGDQINQMLQAIASNPKYHNFLRTLVGVDETLQQSKVVVWLLVGVLAVLVIDLLLRIKIRFK